MEKYVFYVKDGDVLLRQKSLTEFEIWSPNSKTWSKYLGDRARVRQQAWPGREFAAEVIVQLGGTVEDLDKE